MRAISTVLVAALFLSAVPPSSGANISATRNADAMAIYLDGEAQNGAFDTIFFRATPVAPLSFANNNSGAIAGIPRPPGEPFTYPNRMLTADPLDFPGGLGLTQVGLINTPQELSFTAGALGGTITTAAQPNGDLFLGNLHIPGAGFFATPNVTVQLISGGLLVQELTFLYPPEPATVAMAAMGMVGMLAVTRKKRRTC